MPRPAHPGDNKLAQRDDIIKLAEAVLEILDALEVALPVARAKILEVLDAS